ncbi:hypothetical protein SAMN05443252_104304 [Bacillus sp. OV322]|nr:hypothetical protein [Bacillus sp. OV322]SFC55911.1 hypothetical protein SAMN05443252_104304 [Bacillus sp. OV322]
MKKLKNLMLVALMLNAFAVVGLNSNVTVNQPPGPLYELPYEH